MNLNKCFAVPQFSPDQLREIVLAMTEEEPELADLIEYLALTKPG